MKISFDFQNEKYDVEAEMIQGQLWLHFMGKTWLHSPEQKVGRARSTQKSGSQNQMTAPMPGKIIKLNVVKGDSLAPGEVVVIMEAMKMEYTLKTDRQVIVDSVLVKNGQQVRLGETLVTFQNESSKS